MIEAAANGQPTIVTKRGRPAVMVVPFKDGQRLYPVDRLEIALLNALVQTPPSRAG